MDAYDQLRNTRNLWGFAMFIHEAVQAGQITRATFKDRVRFLTSEDGAPDTGMLFAQQYDTAALDDLSFNLLQLTAASAAIQADTALDGLFGKPKSAAPNAEIADLRELMYMVRCAFAHDPFHPKWLMNPSYQRKYDVRSAGVRADLSAINGQGVRPMHFGGWEGFYALLSFALRVALAHGPPPTP